MLNGFPSVSSVGPPRPGSTSPSRREENRPHNLKGSMPGLEPGSVLGAWRVDFGHSAWQLHGRRGWHGLPIVFLEYHHLACHGLSVCASLSLCLQSASLAGP